MFLVGSQGTLRAHQEHVLLELRAHQKHVLLELRAQQPAYFESKVVILANFIRISVTDILKVDFFARSKLNFSNFAQEKVEKYH